MLKIPPVQDILKLPWLYLEDNDPTALWHQADGWLHIIKKTGKHLGVYQRSMLVTFTGFKAALYCHEGEWKRLGQCFTERFINEPAWRHQVLREIRAQADRLFAWNEQILRQNLVGWPSIRLLRLHRQGIAFSGDLYGWAALPVYADVAYGILTARLLSILTGAGLSQARANAAFVALTTPKKISFFQREEKKLARLAHQFALPDGPAALAALTKQGSAALPPPLRKKLAAHSAYWQFLGYSFLGRPLPPNYFFDRFKEMARATGQRHRQTSGKTAAAPPLPRLSSAERARFAAAAELLWLKDYRKAALMQYYFTADRVNCALAVSSGLPYQDILMMQESELVAAVQKNKLPSDLEARREQCVMLILGGRAPSSIISGRAAGYIIKELELRRQVKPETRLIKGQVAYPGTVEGRVRVVKTEAESRALQAGEILVSPMTYPDLLPAMRRAAAFVTDTGGITCHAAIVARELKKPCVIGTKFATQVLKNGDWVLVNAEVGEVKKLAT